MAHSPAPILTLIVRNRSMQMLVFKSNALISSFLFIFQMEYVVVFHAKYWDASGIDTD